MATRDRGAAPTTAGASEHGRPLRRLVIVESPTKAKKIAPYLGSGYVVEASVGHIRDLPRGAADIPAKYKGEPWARLGVDVDHDFEPIYVVSPDKKAKVSELKHLLADADELFLATDPDREGEAIAWHLLETLKPKVPVRRMVFHEITKPAILAAAADTRELDNDLVDAQETRRILDRLYGYEVSPVLWKKVMPKLSAGRVQSVATRIIVQRERERMAFRTAEYWDIAAKFDTGGGSDVANPRNFGARLISVDGARVAGGRDFGSDGQVKTAGVTVLDEARARRLAEALHGVDFRVDSVESKPYTRKPYAPFMTSTLQQEAARKLRFGSERTMRVAQRLYENGYITYMRTDSTTLSESAIAAARAQATQLYGSEFVHPTPRQYTRKVKNAQEAHEAIRPSGDTFATPGQLHGRLDNDEFRLYELIWQRTVASQMADARGTTLTVKINGHAGTGEDCVFSASGRTITFPGFLKAYVESVDEESESQSDDAESRLPALTEGQQVAAAELNPDGHSTNPPARYNEASLIKTLEDLGIGRPSTYASIIKTILDRGYVYKRGSALVPSWVAFSVVGLLEAYFGRLVDFDFTAAMEDDLDDIAGGREQRGNWLSSFYFGGEHGAEGSVARSGGLKRMVGENLDDIDARSINSIKLFVDSEGRDVVVRVGRFGPYLERMVVNPDDPDGDPISQRANLPDDLPPDELTPEAAEKLFATPQEGRELGVDPATGHRIVAKEGRFGPYVTEILPEPATDLDAEPKKGAKKAAAPKPRTGSLFKGMDTATVTLEEALQLLSLPRVVGTDPATGEEITAQNGRYGPYLKKGTDSRSLATEEQLFTVTLEQALALYAEPKRRGRQASAAAPLRELGADSATGKPMVIKDGRFGPYVTDGETNASLRKGDEVESITDERASELLADRRAKAPVKKAAKKAAKKAPAKKTAAKKTAAKKTATKTAAKTATKAVAKKAAAKKAPAKKAAAKAVPSEPASESASV
ncbi:type I DNA topoisomerase [Nocardia stercoris]|uniref:DNA topoisomerase 1 n=1 Tax=Nocardia stercoris TaxID=2483361 RepID=A0A3M2KXC9_9NOCA|nr:type I DNA topoisomerase [Nocardia stercoris]RMI29296.1 type I DNA topoisomerase [Nocardia stercoris]